MGSDRLFSDIENHWAKDCIEQLASRKVILGFPNGQFRPNASVTRAEFATLMYWVFPWTLPVQEAIAFPDVPSTYWAYRAITWGYKRRLLSGFPDGSFRPDQPVTRLQALLVLTRGLRYSPPADVDEVLPLYFDDADEIPPYAKGAIAAATVNRLVVNYPDVRKLRPGASATRGEVSALLCQTLGLDDQQPSPHVTWFSSLRQMQGQPGIPLALLKSNSWLVQDIQSRLQDLKLYPAKTNPNGKYDAQTEAALMEFAHVLGLPLKQTEQLDDPLVQTLLQINPICFVLEAARDRAKLYAEFLQQEAGYSSAKLAFLDRGIHKSPYAKEIDHFPTYLNVKPDGERLVSSEMAVAMSGLNAALSYTPYPKVGKLPDIDTGGLHFLHSDIQQACVCVGSFVDDQLKTRWLGRDPLRNVELWSATKFVPLLEVACRVNAKFPTADLDNLVVRPQQGRNGYDFYDLAVDLVSYEQRFGSSNALAAMFKQLDSPQNIENWLKGITGHTDLQFRGRYGEGAFIAAPELWDEVQQKVVLTASGGGPGGDNALATYDLTRLISMLGWHLHLPPDARFPSAQWNSLESIIRAMGTDSARYVDVAIERLGLANVIWSPVIFSKLGFGYSGIRHRTELVYSAFVQFIDEHLCYAGQPTTLRSVGMTLIAAKKLGNGDREATELDARMAAEVTEILRRVVTQELR